MTITASMPRAAESTHWYTRDGMPRYTIIGANGKERNTTLRDARKEGLVPSVTTILKVASNPVLTQWMQKQVLMAALTLPKVEGESEDEYIARIINDSKEHGRNAANIGTNIHNAVQSYYEGKSDSTYVEHRKGCVRALQAHYGDVVWISERAFGHEMGFGGKCDLHSPQGDGIVVDIKTKDFDDPKKIDGYDEHLMQLSAYRVGLGIPLAKCSNVFVSRTVAGLSVVKDWSEEDLARGWLMFYNLLRFWQLKNGHE
jgi:hypothetical protein